MKNKKKMIAMVEIAIVLCLVFLVALPATAIAAEQTTQNANANTITTASEDDYVLGVYGNANEDDTIDMRDLTYVKLIFFDKKPETELADAKYDGKINPLDFIQIKLIIVGKEKELTIVDARGEAVKINKPIERIICFSTDSGGIIKAIGAKDKIVGVTKYFAIKTTYFPELSKLPSVGGWPQPDIEKVLELEPDIFIVYGHWCEGLEDKLEPAGVTVVRLDFFRPEIMEDEIKKLGYCLDKVEGAKELVDFYTSYLNKIDEKVKKLSEEEKPRVFLESYSDYMASGKYSGSDAMCTIAGGINIASDLPIISKEVDPEWIITQNPDIIVKAVSQTSVSCGYDEDNVAEMKTLRDKIMSRPGFANIKAVKNGKIYLLAADIGHGSTYFVGITYMAKWFHPDLFEDLDPQAIHQEYLTRFQRLDYDLDKHGVFVYHPEEHPDGK
jgi:iron complex transport system substrate-binding protein